MTQQWDMVVVKPPEPWRPLKLQTGAPSKAKPYNEKKLPDENPNRAGLWWGDEGKNKGQMLQGKEAVQTWAVSEGLRTHRDT